MKHQRDLTGGERPKNEREVASLIERAKLTGRKLRVAGAGHSFRPAIWPDDGSVLRVSLDEMREVSISEQPGGGAIAEVAAGCRLGKDPLDRSGKSSWSNSLNVQLQKRGYALSDLGGISHQSVAGFLATGSSGGSVAYSIYDDVEKIRFVDGRGQTHEVTRSDQPDVFHAVGVSMGLLGVITRVWLKAEASYNVRGKEVTSKTEDAAIDFFGSAGPRPSFEQFLRETAYTRMMWWPQNNLDRMVVWQAGRLASTPDFEAKPYQELGRYPRAASLAGSLIFTLIGNLDDLSQVPEKLDAMGYWELLDEALDADPDPNACTAVKPYDKTDLTEVLSFVGERLRSRVAQDPELSARRGWLTKAFARVGGGANNVWDNALSNVLVKLVELTLDGLLESPLAKPLGRWLKKQLPTGIDEVVGLFVEIRESEFQDTWLCGLPMDNQMDDRLWATEFTELWVPLTDADKVMRKLRDFYRAGRDPKLALEHTGTFSCELYAAKKSDFWLSPSYGSDMLRIDLLWFAHNAENPSENFYPQYWELLEEFGLRPHWGKILPPASHHWVEHYRRVFPKLDAFLELRRQFDPEDVFLTDYWRAQFGI